MMKGHSTEYLLKKVKWVPLSLIGTVVSLKKVKWVRLSLIMTVISLKEDRVQEGPSYQWEGLL